VTDLLVARCSTAAARYAVEHWHYSAKMPNSKLFLRGVWEDGVYVGAVIFGYGASPFMSRWWGLTQTECVELVRVALTDHVSPVTQIVAEALRQLRAANPGLRLVVSFADPQQGHHGGIYQAGNWTYCGRSKSGGEYVIRGRQMHMRAIGQRFGTTSLEWIRANIDPDAYAVQPPDKYRYAIGLDRAARRLVASRAETPPERLEAKLLPALVEARGRVAAEDVSP
jgi:hypothetical protein